MGCEMEATYYNMPCLRGAGKRASSAAQACTIVLICTLLWALSPAPESAIRRSSPLPLGAAAAGRLHKNYTSAQNSACCAQQQQAKAAVNDVGRSSSSNQKQQRAPATKDASRKQLHQHQQLQVLQQQKRDKHDGEGVDIVFLWVNGSDPLLLQELEQFSIQGTGPGKAVLQPTDQTARYDSSRDELRYSLRSLEEYLSWYRHIYLVTNGQVPNWLDLSNPRLTVVPHSTLYEQASEVPTFNSNGIQTKLLNIPGLSSNFIVMDDDWFLTAYWHLDDFIGKDGAQVVTGSGSASASQGYWNPYLASIKYCDGLFTQMFGPWNRFIPAHSPKFMQREWLRRVMAQLPEAYRATGANRFRTGHDIIMAAAYEWYVDQHQPGNHSRLPDEAVGFITLNDGHLSNLILQAINDFKAAGRSGNGQEQLPYSLTVNHTEGAAACTAAVAGRQQGPAVKLFENYISDWLRHMWTHPRTKMVCLNDDMTEQLSYGRPLLNPMVRRFLERQYPAISQYELPPGTYNTCGRIKSAGFGKLPTPVDIAAACGTAALPKQLPKHTEPASA